MNAPIARAQPAYLMESKTIPAGSLRSKFPGRARSSLTRTSSQLTIVPLPDPDSHLNTLSLKQMKQRHWLGVGVYLLLTYPRVRDVGVALLSGFT